jgi:putative Mg2+ transporter-C (MgtC) family protein
METARAVGPTGTGVSANDFLIRLIIAQFLGAGIGIERQWRHRLAGIVTNALVSTGAAIFTMLGAMAGEHDPIRVVAYVVSGIGFLGGGVILREGFSVHGLNTAATLWCSASVGCVTGAGFLWQASAGAVAIVISNVVYVQIEEMFNRWHLQEKLRETRYAFSIVCRHNDEGRLRALLESEVSEAALTLHVLHSQDTVNPDQVQVQAHLSMVGRNDKITERVAYRMSLEPGVSTVRWEIIDDRPD